MTKEEYDREKYIITEKWNAMRRYSGGYAEGPEWQEKAEQRLQQQFKELENLRIKFEKENES